MDSDIRPNRRVDGLRRAGDWGPDSIQERPGRQRKGMAPRNLDSEAETHRSLLERVLTASARDVAPGGETGAWQWLLPALVVMVILAGAFAVLQSSRQADQATHRADVGSAVADAL